MLREYPEDRKKISYAYGRQLVADGLPLAMILGVGLSLYKRKGFFWNRYKTATNMEQLRDVAIVGLPVMLL